MKVITLHKNLEQLLEKARTNNRKAQQQLYEMFAPKMLSVCRQYIKDISLAEEVMVGGFFKAFTALDSFKGSGSFEGWLRRIMVRESISWLRKERKLHFESEEAIDHTTQHAVYLDSPLEVEHLQLLIDELPEGYKMVFVMYAVEGYKHSEIAETLGISESTSKSQLFKARKLLQRQLNAQNKTSYGTP
ncbi:RNA polymerase sigma factor [Gilvibacter sediminis]|uniref:RNA polymerase sigma factor n=1 Tax=Gilvibacter sediminis TaxID=379071 RepID=UPI0023503D17|nr:RNA polymerase sigma factor [Gilvibacter sediminis]MDC7998665.1 RNA polymerase sigma factor [Gilvibacter sediminis]